MLFFKYLPGLYQGADHTGRRVMNLGGGSSPPPAPTQTSSISIPEYAQPYMERLLGRSEALMEAPYQPYGGERFAGPTLAQQQARYDAAQLQTPGQFDVGTGLVGAAGLAGLAANYDPTQFTAQQVQAPQLSLPSQVTAQNIDVGGIRAAQMDMPDTFGAEQAQQYMSPYMQSVVEMQKQAAAREAQLAGTRASLAAARRPGVSGSSGQLIAQAERERGLLDRLGQIQATGSQAAFEQAQQQFERDRSARMQAQMANLSNEQQARVQNEANRLQAAGMNQQRALEAALANQRAELGVQELGAQTSLEAQRANQQAMLEAQRLGEQSRQFGSEFGLRGQELGLRAGETMARIGSAEQAAELDRLKFQEAMGQLSQADQQRLYDLQYQDFRAQQQYPYQQIGFMSDILRGSGSLAKNVGVYDAPASPLQQIVGPGLLGLGLYREFSQS